MPRFTHSTQKYDQNGLPIPKGKGQIQLYKKKFPELMVFDSKSEYKAFLHYQELEQAGLIQELQYQTKFELIPEIIWFNNIKQKKEKIRGMCYIADFTFIRDGQKYAVDCKGWTKKTNKKGLEQWKVYYDEIYKIKKRLFLQKYTDYKFEEI